MINCYISCYRRSARITKWCSTWTIGCALFCKTHGHSSAHSRHSISIWTWFWETAKNSEKSAQRTANCQSAKRNVCWDSFYCVARTLFRLPWKDHRRQRKVCRVCRYPVPAPDQVKQQNTRINEKYIANISNWFRACYRCWTGRWSWHSCQCERTSRITRASSRSWRPITTT